MSNGPLSGLGAILANAALRPCRRELAARLEKITASTGSAGRVLNLGPGALPAAAARPLAGGSCAAVAMFMPLHAGGAEGVLAWAARLLKPENGRLLLLEWKLPERNLDYLFQPLVHGFELCAGRRHYREFRAFMRQGGSEGAIQRHNLSAAEHAAPELLITERAFLGLGALVLLGARVKA